jgi:hypothetical protein
MLPVLIMMLMESGLVFFPSYIVTPSHLSPYILKSSIVQPFNVVCACRERGRRELSCPVHRDRRHSQISTRAFEERLGRVCTCAPGNSSIEALALIRSQLHGGGFVSWEHSLSSIFTPAAVARMCQTTRLACRRGRRGR